jgi:hypothetical protein
MRSSVFEQRFWWPLDLSPRSENAFAQFRSQLLEQPVSVDETLVQSVSDQLARVMSHHISALIYRDSLPHLSHVLNGWGDFSIDGARISDRIERFIHRDSRGRPYILQCDPEGEVHPWQTLAYAVMAGVDPDETLGSSETTIRQLALNSRQLDTKEGRELGHLLFALADLDPDMTGGPFFLENEPCDLPKLMKLADEAHHFGSFEVCRKFHLTEGLCAVATNIPGFERYHDAAQGFLDGQLDILLVLGIILEQASQLIPANEEIKPDSLIQELRDALVLGPYIENHCYYAGHIIELAVFANSFGYRIGPEHRSAMAFVINQLNQMLPPYLPHTQFIECFLHFGHYRRAITLFTTVDQEQANGRPFTRAELTEFNADIEGLRRVEDVVSEDNANTEPPPAIFAVAHEPISRRAVFERIVAEYEKIAPREFEARGVRGTSYHYRRMGPVRWPRALHYELLDYGDMIGTEIHLESDAVRPLGNLVRSLMDQASSKFPTLPVEWDPKWSNGRGRLRVLFPSELPAGTIAAGMVTLINETSPIIDAAVSEDRQLAAG